MDLAFITAKNIIEMFLILFIGVFTFKAGIADSGTGSRLTSLLLNVISPCVILLSYQIDFDKDRLIGLLLTAGGSVVSFLAAILIAKLVVPERGRPHMAVERMSIVYSNCGFIGIPLIQALLGAQGVFYMTAYITVFNVFVWSHGIMLMSGKAKSPGATLKNLIQPSTIAIVAGLVFFITGFRFPAVIKAPISMIADMNTPAAMLISGMNLAESNIISCLKTPGTYLLSAAKLILVPLVTLLFLMAVRADRVIGITILVAAACPSGAMGTMFALQYQKDSQYASRLLAITTALSLVTIPVIMMAASGIFH